MLGTEIVKGAGVYPSVSTGRVSVTNSCPRVRSPPIGAIIQAGLLGLVWGQIWEEGGCLQNICLESFLKQCLASLLLLPHGLAASRAAARQDFGAHSPPGHVMGSTWCHPHSVTLQAGDTYL